MARQILGSRKQRTRQHVIADLSVHHVEGFILEEGHTAQRLGSDYSYDLLLRSMRRGTLNQDWCIFMWHIWFSVKEK